MDFFSNPIIIDFGAESLKVWHPTACPNNCRIPCAMGVSKFSLGSKEIVVGTALSQGRAKYNLVFPLHPKEKKIDIDALSGFLAQIFVNLGLHLPEVPVLAIVPDTIAGENLEILKLVFFDKFQIPRLCVMSESEVMINGAGSISGVLIDSGATGTRIIPFMDSAILNSAKKMSAFGGNHITDYLLILLQRKYPFIQSVTNFFEVEEFKEKACFLADDFDKLLTQDVETLQIRMSTKFGGDTPIEIDIERPLVPETIFTPLLLGIREESLLNLVANSVQSCPVNLRKNIFQNIILVGGNFSFRNFLLRFKREIQKIPLLAEARIEMLPEPIYGYIEAAKRLFQSKRGLPKEGIITLEEFEKVRKYFTYMSEK